MKQYNKLGLIAIVTLLLITLLGMNLADIAKLTRYEPLATDNTLLVNLAIESALVFMTLKVFAYTSAIYLGIVLFVRTYQRDIDKKKTFEDFSKLILETLKKDKKEDWEGRGNTMYNSAKGAQPVTPEEAFNPKVVDLQFEPKIPNRLRLECYPTFNMWVEAVQADTKLDPIRAIQLNKVINKLALLNAEAELTMKEYAERPKFIVDNVDLTLTELAEVKGFLTNTLEEYIDTIYVSGKLKDIGEIIP